MKAEPCSTQVLRALAAGEAGARTRRRRAELWSFDIAVIVVSVPISMDFERKLQCSAHGALRPYHPARVFSRWVLLPSARLSDYMVPQRAGGCRRPGRDTELVENISDVPIDRLGAETQRIGDGPVRGTGNQV
jgi:hypothetical protein